MLHLPNTTEKKKSMKQSVLVWFDALMQYFDTVNASLTILNESIESDTAKRGIRYPVGELMQQIDTHTDGYPYSIQPIIETSLAVFSDDLSKLSVRDIEAIADLYKDADRSLPHRKVFISVNAQETCVAIAERLTETGAKVRNLYYAENVAFRVVISLAVIYTAGKIAKGFPK